MRLLKVKMVVVVAAAAAAVLLLHTVFLAQFSFHMFPMKR